MKALLAVGVLTAFVFGSGCQSVMDRRIAAHQDTWQHLSQQQRERLLRQRVQVGDTEEMVSIARGRPDKVAYQAARDGRTDTVWQYTTFVGPDPLSDPETPGDHEVESRTTSIAMRDGIVRQVRTTPGPGARPVTMPPARSGPVTTEQALEYAKAVLLLEHVVKDEQVHAYVKEVWRFDPAAGQPPAIGSEYGRPMPTSPIAQHPERDGIVFDFGTARRPSLPLRWQIYVTEDGSVVPFQTDVAGVRTAVKNTKPKV